MEKQAMSARSMKAGLILLTAAAAALLAGCRTGVLVAPPSSPHMTRYPPDPSIAVTRTGYTVQVGAFSVLDNARRLAQALNDIGLDAFYYPQSSGLYRVRFGDFPTREAAVREAERLREQNLVEDYFIVRPEDHPVHRLSLPGAGLREKLAATAASFLGVEYAWGGASRREGVDCSGLVQAVYRLNGLNLPRSTTAQYLAGATVTSRRLQKGDLVFFSTSPGRSVSHVGIYVGGNVFIHSPGTGQKVREESLESPYFRDRFSGARAYLD
jgi:hypothetical protein